MADTFKRRKNKFAQVSNLCAYDENLSLEAKGLMLIAMALPEDWKFNRTWLQSKAKVGRDKMQRILKQLEENRYLVRIPKRSDDGKRQEGYIWFFDDEKIPPEEVEKLKGKSLKATDDGDSSGCLKIRQPENQAAGKPTPTNTYINKYKTTTTNKPEKIEFEVFALCLMETLNDMAKEGGWIPEGMQPPKAAWTKSKANALYSKFSDPDPADCAAIVLNDWVRIHAMSMAVHKNADHSNNKTTLS